MTEYRKWVEYNLPIAYTAKRYFGTASSAADSCIVCFGGESDDNAKFYLWVNSLSGTILFDSFNVNWHCIGW